MLVVEQTAKEAPSRPPITYSDQMPGACRPARPRCENWARSIPSASSSRLAARRASGQDAAGLANEPFIGMAVQGDEIASQPARQVDARPFVAGSPYVTL